MAMLGTSCEAGPASNIERAGPAPDRRPPSATTEFPAEVMERLWVTRNGLDEAMRPPSAAYLAESRPPPRRMIPLKPQRREHKLALPRSVTAIAGGCSRSTMR